MRLLLVVNSFASSVTPRNTVVVHRRLSRDHDVEVVETNRRGHATRFAVDAARRGLDAVIAFGGDGTLNEVATGVAGTETALGVLPGGSTNVFARTIGLSNDPVAAADELADALGEGHITPVGLGTVNGRHFCFHTGVGFDAAVVAAVERRASLKRWFGHPLFIWSTVSTWSRGFDRARPNHSVTTGDGRSIDGAFLTVVLNTTEERQRQVRLVGADPVHPDRDRPADRLLPVDGPHVHLDPGLVSARDGRRVEITVPGMPHRVARCPSVQELVESRCRRGLGQQRGAGTGELAYPVHRRTIETRDEPAVVRFGSSAEGLDHAIRDRPIRVEIGVPLGVFDLDVHHRRSAGVECGVKLREPVREFIASRLTNDPPVGELGVVVDHQRPVDGAPDIELDSIGPEGDRRLERLEGVLAGAPVGTSVSDHIGRCRRCHERNVAAVTAARTCPYRRRRQGAISHGDRGM
ncbi:MAG: hypothetical protein EBV88_01865 [Actinobacteria bacterium]|nr:hypothetical protein [Actinomycetota bacterium]